jgi:hypothetical protein
MSKNPRQNFPPSGVRVISGMQYLTNPQTGEKLLDVEDLEHALTSHSTIRRWAYIIHEGTHVHWVATTGDPVREKRAGKQIPRSRWAKWFGVPEEKIWRVLGGEDGLADALIYMLHEGAAGQGKTHYSHDDMHASAGWDWESLVRSRQTALAVSGPGPGPRRQLSVRGRMLEEGLSYREARRLTTVAEEKLWGYRREHLNSTTPPLVHTNIFVQAPMSPERDSLAQIVGQAIAGSEDGAYQPFWWDDYDGEPVLIVEADSPDDLVKTFGSPRAAFQALSHSITAAGAVEVKTSTRAKVRLHHRAVVVVSETPFADFLAALTTLYEDEVRATQPDNRARFSLPLFVEVKPETLAIQLLSNYAPDTADRDAYVHWATMGNRLAETRRMYLSADGTREIEQRQVTPVVEAHRHVTEKAHRAMTARTERVVKGMVWDA